MMMLMVFLKSVGYCYFPIYWIQDVGIMEYGRYMEYLNRVDTVHYKKTKR